MKAIQLHGYGDVDQLRLEEVPKPEPKSGEVLIKVIATSLNPVDWKLREGSLQEEMPIELPYILGSDVAGEITALGSGVNNRHTGEHVMGYVNHSYAEYLTAKADALTTIPEDMDVEEAAALPLVVLTGAQLIEKQVKPEAGETVLVTGAVGSVGRAAVFTAKQRKAKVIAGVRSTQKDEAKSLQADGIVALDDDREIASLPQLDSIADTVGGPTLFKLLPRLKKNGVIGSVVGEPQVGDRKDIRTGMFLAKPDGERLASWLKPFSEANSKFRLRAASTSAKFRKLIAKEKKAEREGRSCFYPNGLWPRSRHGKKSTEKI